MSEPRLRVNPSLKLRVQLSWGERNRPGRQSRFVDFQKETDLLEYLIGAAKADSACTIPLSQELFARLRAENILVSEEEAPRAAALDLRLPDAAPSATGEPSSASGEDLVVHSECFLQEGDELPAALVGRVTKQGVLPRERPMLWVDDPGTEMLCPYLLDSDAGIAARRLLAEEISPREVPAPLREVLTMARILVPKDHRASRAAEWQSRCASLAEDLKRDHYAVIRGLLNPLQLSFCRAYIAQLPQSGTLGYDEHVQDNKRMCVYREPLCEFLHGQTRALASRIVGETVKDSYSFFGIYEPGAVLEKHRDRPQCKWNISLALDATPGTGEADGWPLYIESRGTPQAVRLAPGDCVLYSGTDVYHWREAQPEGHRLAAAFLHFVPNDFSGNLD
jgi:hypothetical protein